MDKGLESGGDSETELNAEHASFPGRDQIERDLREAAAETAGDLSCPCGWSGHSSEAVTSIRGMMLAQVCPRCGRDLMFIEINY
jgi:hypothetical protein